jgi:hypothetical protein
VLAGAGPQRLVDGGQPAVVRGPAVTEQALGVPGRVLKPNGPWLLSIDRRAFCRASGKLRPMAIASPTLFMCVVSAVSAPGNFSNANRGTLVTT